MSRTQRGAERLSAAPNDKETELEVLHRGSYAEVCKEALGGLPPDKLLSPTPPISSSQTSSDSDSDIFFDTLSDFDESEEKDTVGASNNDDEREHDEVFEEALGESGSRDIRTIDDVRLIEAPSTESALLGNGHRELLISVVEDSETDKVISLITEEHRCILQQVTQPSDSSQIKSPITIITHRSHSQSQDLPSIQQDFGGGSQSDQLARSGHDVVGQLSISGKRENAEEAPESQPTLTDASSNVDNQTSEYNDVTLSDSNTHTASLPAIEATTSAASFSATHLTDCAAPADDASTDAALTSDTATTAGDICSNQEQQVNIDPQHGTISSVNDIHHETVSSVDDTHRETVSSENDIHNETVSSVNDILRETVSSVDGIHRETVSSVNDTHHETVSSVDDIDHETISSVNDIHRETVSSVNDIHHETVSSVDDIHRETVSSVNDIHQETVSSVDDIHQETVSSVNNIHNETVSSVKDIDCETISSVDDIRRETVSSVNDIHQETVSSVDDIHRETVSSVDDIHRETVSSVDDIHCETVRSVDDIHREEVSTENDTHNEAVSSVNDIHRQTVTSVDKIHHETVSFVDDKNPETVSSVSEKPDKTIESAGDIHDENPSYPSDALDEQIRSLGNNHGVVSSVRDTSHHTHSSLNNIPADTINSESDIPDETISSVSDIPYETITSVSDIHDATITSLSDIHDETITSVSYIPDETISSVSDITDETIISVSDIYDEVITSVNDIANETISSASDMPDETISSVSDIPDETITSVSDITDEIITSVSDIPDEIITSVSDIPDETIPPVSDIPDETFTSVSDIPDETISSVSDIPDETISSVSDILEDIINSVIDIAEGTIISASDKANDTVCCSRDTPYETIDTTSEKPNETVSSAIETHSGTISSANGMSHQTTASLKDIPAESIGSVSDIPCETISSVSDIPCETISSVSDITCETISSVSDIPCETISPVSDIPCETISSVSDIPCETSSSVSDIPCETISSVSDIPKQRISSECDRTSETASRSHLTLSSVSDVYNVTCRSCETQLFQTTENLDADNILLYPTDYKSDLYEGICGVGLCTGLTHSPRVTRDHLSHVDDQIDIPHDLHADELDTTELACEGIHPAINGSVLIPKDFVLAQQQPEQLISDATNDKLLSLNQISQHEAPNVLTIESQGLEVSAIETDDVESLATGAETEGTTQCIVQTEGSDSDIAYTQDTNTFMAHVQTSQVITSERTDTGTLSSQTQITETITPETRDTDVFTCKPHETETRVSETQETEVITSETQERDSFTPEQQGTGVIVPETQELDVFTSHLQESESFEPETTNTDEIALEKRDIDVFTPLPQEIESHEPEARDTDEFTPDAQDRDTVIQETHVADVTTAEKPAKDTSTPKTLHTNIFETQYPEEIDFETQDIDASASQTQDIGTSPSEIQNIDASGPDIQEADVITAETKETDAILPQAQVIRQQDPTTETILPHYITSNTESDSFQIQTQNKDLFEAEIQSAGVSERGKEESYSDTSDTLINDSLVPLAQISNAYSFETKGKDVSISENGEKGVLNPEAQGVDPAERKRQDTDALTSGTLAIDSSTQGMQHIIMSTPNVQDGDASATERNGSDKFVSETIDNSILIPATQSDDSASSVFIKEMDVLTPETQDKYSLTSENKADGEGIPDVHLTKDLPEEQKGVTSSNKSDSHVSPEIQNEQIITRKESALKEGEENLSGSKSTRTKRFTRRSQECEASRRELDLLVAKYRLSIASDSNENRKSSVLNSTEPTSPTNMPVHSAEDKGASDGRDIATTEKKEEKVSDVTETPKRRVGRRVLRRAHTADYLRDVTNANCIRSLSNVQDDLKKDLKSSKTLDAGLGALDPRRISRHKLSQSWNNLQSALNKSSTPLSSFSSVKQLTSGQSEPLNPLNWSLGSLPRLKGRQPKNKLNLTSDKLSSHREHRSLERSLSSGQVSGLLTTDSLFDRRKSDSTLTCSSDGEQQVASTARRRSGAAQSGRKYSFAGIPKVVTSRRKSLSQSFGDSGSEDDSYPRGSVKSKGEEEATSIQITNDDEPCYIVSKVPTDSTLNTKSVENGESKNATDDPTAHTSSDFDTPPTNGEGNGNQTSVQPHLPQHKHDAHQTAHMPPSSVAYDARILQENIDMPPVKYSQSITTKEILPHYITCTNTTICTTTPSSKTAAVTIATHFNDQTQGKEKFTNYERCMESRHGRTLGTAAAKNEAAIGRPKCLQQQIEKGNSSSSSSKEFAGVKHLGNVRYITPSRLLHAMPTSAPASVAASEGSSSVQPSSSSSHHTLTSFPSHSSKTSHTFRRPGNLCSIAKNKDVLRHENSFFTTTESPGNEREISSVDMDTEHGVAISTSRPQDTSLKKSTDNLNMVATVTSPSSSRTGTPTLVRARPRLPTSLIGSSKVQGDRAADGRSVEDLSGALTSLGNTDFVRKYSRRNKRVSGVASPSSVCSTPGSVSKSPMLSPPPEAENKMQNRGSLTLTRMRSIKLKLQRVKEKRDSEEQNEQCYEVSEVTATSTPSYNSAYTESTSSPVVAGTVASAGNTDSKTTPPVDSNLPCTNGAAIDIGVAITTANVAPQFTSYTLLGRSSARRFSQSRAGEAIAIPVAHFSTTKHTSAVISSTTSISVSSLKSTPKTVFSSLQDLCTNNDTDTTTELTWTHTLHTPEQFKAAAKQIETLMASSSENIQDATSSRTEGGVSQDAECMGPSHTCQRGRLKAVISTDSDASSSSVRLKPIPTSDTASAPADSADDISVLSLQITDHDDDISSPSRQRRHVPLSRPKHNQSSVESDDEGIGAVDGNYARQEEGPRGDVRIPTIVAPGDDKDTNAYLDSFKGYQVQRSPNRNGRNVVVVEDSGQQGIESRTSSQLSITSIDSHLSPGESSCPPSYHEVVQDVTSERTTVLERKNSKPLKHKSKSDPCGEKKESIHIPSVISNHAQSAPVLEEGKDSLPQLPEFSHSDAERRISRSDNTLSSSDATADSPTESRLKEVSVRVVDSSGESSEEVLIAASPLARHHHRRPSKKRQRSLAAAVQKWDQREVISGGPAKSPKPKAKSVKHSSRSPHQSPDSTLDKKTKRSGLASLGLPIAKKTSLTRSHSSASVLSRDKHERIRSKDLTGEPKVSKGDGQYAELHSPGSGRANRDKTLPASFSPSLEPIFSQSTLSLFDGAAEEKEKRDLIVQEFYSTEQQYVETLQMLVEKYLIPMKAAPTLDSNLVDDIFYKINEIYMHHATFLTFLGRAVTTWTHRTTIGDVIYRNFSKETVIGSYVSFIDNFPRAEKVLDEISNKTSFQKFLEQIEKQGRTKLPLKAMIIQPAQRIPRYELLIKRLLGNTPEEHPDHELLVKAEQAVHEMALKINSVKESKHGADLQETLKKLELLLITDLMAPDRLYLRHDMISLLNRKDPCCIWLFSDLVVFTSIKRKSGPVSRKTTVLLQCPAGNDFVENTKHKTWLKIPLDDLEILKGGGSTTRRPLVDKEQLEEDFTLLNNIAHLTSQLNCGHSNLDEVVHELRNRVNKQLSEHQLKSPPPEANRVELLATTTEGLTNVTIVFPSPDKRASWESVFIESKQKLADNTVGRPPEFLQALQITKTRAGMQFSCASPIDGVNADQHCDVWVCNSDGYVGHMCLLSLQPEPIVTLNTPVPGCNSRILCICAVPPYQPFRRKGSGRRHGISQVTPPQIRIQETEEEHDGYSSDSSSSSMSDDDYDDTLDQQHGGSTGNLSVHFPQEQRSRSQSPDLGHKEAFPLDPMKCTMWLGTEDGCILIFPSTENIKTTKNKVKVQQSSGILCIVHYDHRVFVSLANGDIAVFSRDECGVWDVNNPEVLSVSNASAPVNKMHPVAGKLWCTCHNEIIILNPISLQIEVTFQACSDDKKGLQCVASSGLAVWVAPQGGASVLLYHATTFELLLEVSVKQAVTQKLQATDDIIRQHKTACLRITALLACKDLLWIGTSAGVVLTLPMPKIASTTTRTDVNLPTVSGLVYGHTGHVRFLTSVEMPTPKFPSLLDSCPSTESTQSEGTVRRPSWMARRASLTQHTLTLATKMLIISGGDGYEDFRNNANNESAGKDDSTNHLLLWQV